MAVADPKFMELLDIIDTALELIELMAKTNTFNRPRAAGLAGDLRERLEALRR